MSKGRMEAFSDGVIAVIITIMVLEIKSPHGTDRAALQTLVPVFLSYLLSFVFVGIYWNNHHHLLHAAEHVTGGVLWANLHLLFWLSLIPFATDWMGENHFAPLPVALYGTVLLLAAIAYFLLTKVLIAHHGTSSKLAASIGRDRKGKASVVVYAAAIRRALDAAGRENTPILSYAAKFASAFYGPFREAADSAPQFGDRRAYQMDSANLREAMREIEGDLAEGADMILMKPAMPYADVIREARNRFDIPLGAYQVSGEYAMLQAAFERGWLERDRAILESLLGLRRAGAGFLVTYFAKDAARLLGR